MGWLSDYAKAKNIDVDMTPRPAAEVMDGEMPEGFTSSNRAAGPTETELAKADDALDELDRRRWEAEWGEASR